MRVRGYQWQKQSAVVMDMNFSTLLDLDRGQHHADGDLAETTTAAAAAAAATATAATCTPTTVIVSSGSSSGSTPSDLPPLASYRPQRTLDDDNDDDVIMHAPSAAHHHHHHHHQHHQHHQQQLSAAPTTNGYDNNMIAGGYAYCNSPYDPYYAQTFAPLPPYTDIRNSALSLTQSQQHQPQLQQQQQVTAALLQTGDCSGSNATRKQEKQKRQRTAYSSEQLMHLEESFTANQYLNRARRIDLARTLRLTERQIKIWFQNRRMKEKKSKRESGRVESTSGGGAAPPMAIPVTASNMIMGSGYGGHYADNGCSSPILITNKMMRYSPTNSYSSPSPPSVVRHHQHQLVENQLRVPSSTLHYSPSNVSATVASAYNNVCPPAHSQPPTYEQTIINGQQQLSHHHVHHDWYPTSVISSHHQSSATADGLQ